MKLSAILIVVTIVAFSFGWYLSEMNSVAQQHQVEAEVSISDALSLLEIIDSNNVEASVKNSLWSEVIKKVVVARTLPHKVSEFKGRAIIALCALIDRKNDISRLGGKLDAKVLALVTEYLESVENEAKEVAQRYSTVLPNGACGI